MEIAALVSGGVDSSVVVHQLKEAGYDPTIFYIRIGMEDKDGYIDCPAEEDIEITSYIARKYGCRMEVVSLPLCVKIFLEKVFCQNDFRAFRLRR